MHHCDEENAIRQSFAVFAFVSMIAAALPGCGDDTGSVTSSPKPATDVGTGDFDGAVKSADAEAPTDAGVDIANDSATADVGSDEDTVADCPGGFSCTCTARVRTAQCAGRCRGTSRRPPLPPGDAP